MVIFSKNSGNLLSGWKKRQFSKADGSFLLQHVVLFGNNNAPLNPTFICVRELEVWALLLGTNLCGWRCALGCQSSHRTKAKAKKKLFRMLNRLPGLYRKRLLNFSLQKLKKPSLFIKFCSSLNRNSNGLVLLSSKPYCCCVSKLLRGTFCCENNAFKPNYGALEEA